MCRVSVAIAAVCIVVAALCSVPSGVADAAALRLQSFTVVATGDVLLHQDGALVRGAAAAGRATRTGFDFSGSSPRLPH